MRIKKKYRIPGLTTQQMQWLQSFEGETTFEPDGLDELTECPSRFFEISDRNIERFKAIADEIVRTLERERYDMFETS